MKLTLQNVGPITEAELTFGDLTVLVGPQASGKSIALQMLKLMVDAGSVQEVMTKQGLDWSGKSAGSFSMPTSARGCAISGMTQKAAFRGKASRLISANWLAAASGTRQSRCSSFPRNACSLCATVGRDRSPTTPLATRSQFAVQREIAQACRGVCGAARTFPQERRLKWEFREMLKTPSSVV